MKRLAISIAVSALASTAYAGGDKETILHCGCSDLEEGSPVVMEYKEISVSSKSKGHRRHTEGSESTCIVGYEEIEEDGEIVQIPIIELYARTGDDCGDLAGLTSCTVSEGEICGEVVVEEPVAEL
jgi:hypothetical protein